MQLPDTSRSSSSEHESNRSGGDETSWTASDVEEFFEEKIESWQAVLGRTMHYNFGTRDPNASADDAEAHLNHSVRSLYPRIFGAFSSRRASTSNTKNVSMSHGNASQHSG